MDDLAQLLRGEWREIVDWGARSAVLLIGALKANGVVISPKSTLVASTIQIARETSDIIFAATGVRVGAAIQGVDLGVDFGGAKRVVANQKLRGEKADRRNTSIKYLSSLAPEAEKLVMTGSTPQRTYGLFVYGCPPARLGSWRASDCRARGIAKSGCNTTALAMRGERCDPGITAPVDQIRLWNELWGHIQEQDREEVRKAWFILAPKLRDNGWRVAAGPAAATIMTLAQIGWRPIGPDLFKDTRGVTWTNPGTSYRCLAQETAVAEAAKNQLWRHAATHYCGRGLQEGGDLTAAKWLRQRLVKDGRKVDAGILDSLVEGATWFGDRFHNADNTYSQACTRCTAGTFTGTVENARHAIWTCGDNANCIGNAVQRSERLAPHVSDDEECLWLRGIVPRKSTHHTLEGQGPWRSMWKYGDLGLFKEAGTNPCLKVASDGAGGKHGSDRRIARVGWGAVAV